MEFKPSWQVLGGAVAAYYLALVFYRLFVHPLARFPGPRLAAISRWYEGYYDVILNGQYTSKIAKLHKVYGPIVRISPHELHVNDPAFFDTLYRTDGRWDKYSWAYDAFGAKNSTIFGSDHDAHKSRRRAIAPYFSKPSVTAREGIVRRNTEALRRRVNLAAAHGSSSLFNLGAAVSALTRDTANEFITGKCHGELDRADFGAGLSAASQGAGPFWRLTKHVPWFGPAVRALPVGFVMRVADENMRAFLGALGQSEQDAREIWAKASSSSSSSSRPPPPDKTTAAAAPGHHPTMIHAIVDSDLPPAEKTFARVHEEVMTVTGAGFETTASALRLILFHVYTNEEILRRLREELTTASARLPDTPLTLRALEQLPYLTAVLTEGMRLSPGVASRAARVSDRDLFYGGGWRIPAGTPVGMTSLLMHTDADVFPRPMRFDPGRWLGGSGAGTWAPPRHYYAPFGRGTRICLGMYLAWAEMYLVVATLVQHFDFTFEGVTARDFEMERDNFAIGTRAGCNLMARVSLREG